MRLIDHRRHMEDEDSPVVVVEKRMDPSSMSTAIYGNKKPTYAIPSSSWFEIRLFYIRISPCVPELVPTQLFLSHPRREMGVSLEINASRVPASETTSLALRRDRVDRETGEVTYVSTDSVRFTGPVEFEVNDGKELVMCGSMERLDPSWSNGTRATWSMDCYCAAGIGASSFVQPKMGIASPSLEVYVAGCCSGRPLILSKTVQYIPLKKVSRQGMLDAIPEGGEDTDEGEPTTEGNNKPVLRRKKLPSLVGGDGESHEDCGEDDDGELTWFNAGVRVGVGIGLGMCLGVGIGVGLLMRSYQTTTRNFRRRFL